MPDANAPENPSAASAGGNSRCARSRECHCRADCPSARCETGRSGRGGASSNTGSNARSNDSSCRSDGAGSAVRA